MPNWLLQLLGIDVASIPPDAGKELVWLHVPGSWRFFVFIALVLLWGWGIIRLYRMEPEVCPRPVRRWLTLLRLAVMVILALVFLGPALAILERRVIQPYILVLLDESMSMATKDRYADDQAAQRTAAAWGRDVSGLRAAMPERAALVEHLLQRDDGDFLRQLARHGRVQVMGFSNRVRLRQTLLATGPTPAGGAGLEIGDPVPPLQPTGPATNFARAVREAMASVSGQPVGAVVIVSDGQNTEGDDPLAAADPALAQKTPIFTLGIGDPARPRNLRVVDLWTRDTVWRDDPFQVEAVIQAQGLEAQAVQLELLEEPADRATGATEAPAAQVVARQDVPIQPDGGQQTISFTHRPKQTGKYVYRVRAVPLPGEWNEADNLSRPATVNVVAEASRVLLIAGAPTWDFQNLKNLLLRDKSINLSCWLQSQDLDMPQEGATVITKLPSTPAELFAYDVVLLLDPNPAPNYNPLELRDPWPGMLKTFVREHAGGVLFMAGPRYTAQFLTSQATSEYNDLLPVIVDASEPLDVRQWTTVYARPWPLRFTAEAADHPLMRLAPDANASRRIWAMLPGIFWSFPARMAKPAARTLIEHSAPEYRTSDGARPLLATGQYGAGRVVYLGFEGTWRWRSVGHDSEYFDRFWIQTIRYLVEGRRMGGARRGTLATDNDLYPVGANVRLTARLYDAAFQPLTESVVRGTLTAPGAAASEIELRAVPDRPGQYEASLTARILGANEITLNLPGNAVTPGATPERITRRFNVELPRLEFNDTRLNKAYLTELAQRTGGKYLEIDQAVELPGLIPDRRQTTIIRGKPVDLWDTPSLLIVLAALLATEWAVRKRYKLM